MTPTKPSRDEKAWLVERHFSDRIEYAYMDITGVHWTTDANKAMRLCRRDDAEMLACGCFDGDDIRIAEHLWPIPASKPSRDDAAEALARFEKELLSSKKFYEREELDVPGTLWDKLRDVETIKAALSAQAEPVDVNVELLEALREAVVWAENVDWSNGNTDQTGAIDEGWIYAGKGIARWRRAITKAEAQIASQKTQEVGSKEIGVSKGLHNHSTNEEILAHLSSTARPSDVEARGDDLSALHEKVEAQFLRALATGDTALDLGLWEWDSLTKILKNRPSPVPLDVNSLKMPPVKLEENETDTHRLMDYANTRGWNDCIDHLASTGRIVREGFVAVPVEPTQEMLQAAADANGVYAEDADYTIYPGKIWSAMIEAAKKGTGDV